MRLYLTAAAYVDRPCAAEKAEFYRKLGRCAKIKPVGHNLLAKHHGWLPRGFADTEKKGADTEKKFAVGNVVERFAKRHRDACDVETGVVDSEAALLFSLKYADGNG